MSWEKNSVENVILFCFTEDEGLCRYEEFFDGWWNNAQIFVDKKKWKENMENMKNVFVWRWYHVHVFFVKYEPPWSSILPCQGTLLFHKYVYRTWIQDANVMIWKRQYYTRYMKISQVHYFLCHVLNNKTRKDVWFFNSI